MNSLMNQAPSISLVEQARRELDKRLFKGNPVELARSAKIEPDPWQEKLLLSDSKRILLNCSRQSGKSTTASLKALHRAMFRGNSDVLIVAPSERQSKEFFRKLIEVYHALGELVPADSEQRLTLELANGSRVVALPGTEKTIRGFSASELIIIDEAARIEDELVSTMLPMLAVSGGTLMMLTTPWGKRGIFYQEWMEGDEWERYRVPATDCPRIPAAFLEEEKRRKEPWRFAQEYMCAFVDNEDVVFPSELLEAALENDYRPLFE